MSDTDKAFETLKTYDWGSDLGTLKPIEEAIIATENDGAARGVLEKRLVEALTGGLSRSAVDYVCRRLRVVGTGQSVEALAALLEAQETSHIARFALERIPDDAAVEAMRAALPKVGSKLKPGIIGSLGKRRDPKSVETIAGLLRDPITQTARAAAEALGMIGTKTAAKELSTFAKKAPANMKIPVADACLICAGQLLADGAKAEAIALYKELNSGDQPTHVKVAARKGMLAAMAAR